MYRVSILSETGYAVTHLVRHCATSRKVADSIPGGVIGIFY
jgi:hypothetical protein